MAERKQRRIETTVVKTINLGNYESVKLGATVSTVIADKADINEAFANLWDECNEQVESQVDSYEDSDDAPNETVDDKEIEASETEERETDEVEEDIEEEDDITEDEINSMSKKELVKFCEDTEGLEDIDTSKGVKVLRVLIVDALFEEEDETDPETDSDDEWGDDDWGDDD